jgi:hypothetical protein
MEGAKAGLKPVEFSPSKLPDFETDAVFVGIEAGDYPKINLIVNGAVRQYEPAKYKDRPELSWDGVVPSGVVADVHVEFEGYRVNVTAIARGGSQYNRTIETLRVLSMKVAKAA